MDPAAAKQQIAERVKQANKFLLTVNSNPTVDQLAACIGLTLLLNKMGKHATAVFSGKVPNALEFLQPEKTLQTNTDSLRDFIISLDKNKADKLRYKVEDNVVRIFITPYRTSLSEKDFVFSQGDFNVEAVIALGVNQRTQLDNAITTHGRILHDATVISVNAGTAKAPDIGQINWADANASSLCEMLVSISESFGTGLIDSQMATAFLTGIVAETQRFSNKKTSPKVMTMSAQLMAAGANQQLIVEKLEPPPPPPPKQEPPKPAPPKPKPNAPKPKEPPKPEGTMDVPHGDEPGAGADVDLGTTEIHIDEQGNLLTSEDSQGPAKGPPGVKTPTLTPMAVQTQAEAEPVAVEPEPVVAPPESEPAVTPPEPVPAAPAESDGHPKISQVRSLHPSEPDHHSFMGSTAQPQGIGADFSAGPGQPEWAAPYDLVPMDPMAQAGAGEAASEPQLSPEQQPANFAQVSSVTPPGETPPAISSARSAVDQAISAAPFDPAANPPVQSLNAQPWEPAPAAPPVAPQTTDTPVLVLPTEPSAPVTATTPVAPLPPLDAASGVAPPPVPPPLQVAPGAVVPNYPPQQ